MDDLNWFQMTVTLFGGLALFLFGLQQMTDALKVVAGNRLRSLLASWTRNRVLGMISGTVVTALVQSSSVTTVLVVGFISAGIMNLGQSVAVIMGANIGSTVTAQIIAFKVTALAYLFVAVGYLGSVLLPKHSWKQYGIIVMGLGLLFAGMNLMSEATYPLRGHEGFVSLAASLGDRHMLGIVLGALFTAVVQSSAATAGLVLVLASQGLLNLEGGIALIFGSNIGTCATAGLAAIGRPREAVRAAVVHVLFNVAGVALWFFFIGRLGQLSQIGDPSLPRSLANAHTLFNVITTFLFLPAAPLFARAAMVILPDRTRVDDPAKPKFLDPGYLKDPGTALDAVTREVARQAGMLRSMADTLGPVLAGEDSKGAEQLEAERCVDELQKDIIRYLGRLSSEELGDDEASRQLALTVLTNAIENIGDGLAEHLLSIASKIRGDGLSVSPQTRDKLERAWHEVRAALEDMICALEQGDRELAKRARDRKPVVKELFAQIDEHLVLRLGSTEPNRLEMYRLESDVLELMRIVFSAVRRAGKAEAQVLDGFLSGTHRIPVLPPTSD
ncbi:MAG: Na/Pi cotransporter family protein [Planctomycetota bacterium]|jgi:phosphate:Na+ symporter|nr:Na/Pi cotransporter family protein [Planctomycetota bacterium]